MAGAGRCLLTVVALRSTEQHRKAATPANNQFGAEWVTAGFMARPLADAVDGIRLGARRQVQGHAAVELRWTHAQSLDEWRPPGERCTVLAEDGHRAIAFRLACKCVGLANIFI